MNSTFETEPGEQLPIADQPRRRWLTVLLGLLIFGAGFASGAGVTIVAAVHRLQHAIHHPEEAPVRVAAMVQRKFHLDDGQKSQVEAIVAKHQVQLAAIRQEFLPKVITQLEQIRHEIGQVLAEPQREKWFNMFDDVRDRWLPPTGPVVDKPLAQ